MFCVIRYLLTVESVDSVFESISVYSQALIFQAGAQFQGVETVGFHLRSRNFSQFHKRRELQTARKDDRTLLDG